jgi:DNA-binding NarL/FixJ family response regulator
MPRILIVEDQALVAEAMAAVLTDAGHLVVGIADNQRSALACASTVRPQLVLMDINLASNDDGIETARRLHKEHGLSVVFVTGYTDQRTRRRADGVGPAGYLTKPYLPSDLLGAVSAALGGAALVRATRT